MAQAADKVQFLICGAQKAGTTALASYLQRHPEVLFPIRKEAHFFDYELFDWSSNHHEREQIYHDLFASPKIGIKGESTPVYLYWKPCPERIWRYNPAMRLIVILRNPITRAYSHWNMERSRGREVLPFLEALQHEPSRKCAADPLQDRIHSYVDRGLYSEQLQRLWQWFAPTSTMVLRQEELINDPAGCLERVHEHLGLSRRALEVPLVRHALPYPEPMPREALDWLRKRFGPEIERLQALLGWDCTSWLEWQP